MADDGSNAREDEAKVEAAMADSKIASLFDVRLVVGGLLTLYGVILLVMGLFDGQAAVAKAAGVRINLVTGVVLLVVGVGFLLWMRTRPLRAEPSKPREDTERSSRPVH